MPNSCHDVEQLHSSGTFRQTLGDNIAASVCCDQTNPRVSRNIRYHDFSKVHTREKEHSGKCPEST